METFEQKLDNLNKALNDFCLVDWQFSKDLNHDKQLLDWFIDGGELRIYKTGFSYNIKLKKENISLSIGAIWKDFLERQNTWVNEYTKYFYSRNKNIKFCTNNLLKTPEEICEGKELISMYEYKYSDGSIGKIFDLSPFSSWGSWHKNKVKIIEILDKIEINNSIKDL